MFDIEIVDIAALKPHPRNYRAHPEDEIEHLAASIEEYGFYRNVVIARDGTLLAGHGVVQAAEKLGRTEVPVMRLPVEPNDPRAIKVLVADNEIAHLADSDDRVLANLLKEIRDSEVNGLAGTGYDDAMLAGLLMVTRGRDEVADLDAAAEWVGMPDYAPPEQGIKLLVLFDTPEEREEFAAKNEMKIQKKVGAYTAWWPARDMQQDTISLEWEDTTSA